MKRYRITNEKGVFVANIYAERVVVPADEHGPFVLYSGPEFIAGLGSRYIGVRVFEDEVEVLPLSLRLSITHPEVSAQIGHA